MGGMSFSPLKCVGFSATYVGAIVSIGGSSWGVLHAARDRIGPLIHRNRFSLEAGCRSCFFFTFRVNLKHSTDYADAGVLTSSAGTRFFLAVSLSSFLTVLSTTATVTLVKICSCCKHRGWNRMYCSSSLPLTGRGDSNTDFFEFMGGLHLARFIIYSIACGRVFLPVLFGCSSFLDIGGGFVP